MRHYKLFVVVLASLFLTACIHQQPDSYSWRSRCLEGVIQQCKERGLQYTNHSPACQNALLHGIYTLSDEELMHCRQQDQAQARASQGKG
jgi:hypothetical protein